MADGRPFVVVRLPGFSSEQAKWTAQHANSVIDTALEATGNQGAWTQIGLCRGIPLADVQEMLGALAARYRGPVDVLREESGDVFAYRLDLSAAQQEPAFRILARLQRDFGASWTHVTRGEVSFRIPCRTRVGAQARARKVAAFLADQGLNAEAEVRVVKGRELGAWHEVQDELAEVAKVAPAVAPLPRARGP